MTIKVLKPFDWLSLYCTYNQKCIYNINMRIQGRTITYRLLRLEQLVIIVTLIWHTHTSEVHDITDGSRWISRLSLYLLWWPIISRHNRQRLSVMHTSWLAEHTHQEPLIMDSWHIHRHTHLPQTRHAISKVENSLIMWYSITFFVSLLQEAFLDISCEL